MAMLWPAKTITNAAVASRLVQTESAHPLLPTNVPSASARSGKAGKMYVGNLQPESEKNRTHHPPERSTNPNDEVRILLSLSCPENKKRINGHASKVAGKSPISKIGK